MNNQHPPPLLHCRTTTQIFKRANTCVFSTRHQFLIFLILSLLLFSVKLGTQFIDHLIISNPLIKFQFPHFQSLIPETLPTTAGGFQPTTAFNSELNFQLTENPPIEIQINATSITLDSFNSNLGLLSKTETYFEFANIQEQVHDSSMINDQRINHIIFIASFILISQFWVFTILGFVYTHSCVHGVIFVLLINHLLRRHRPMVTLLKGGTSLGYDRLSPFAAHVRIISRMILTIILVCVGCYFSRINDLHTAVKIVLEVTRVPFFIWFPLVEEFEQGIYIFPVFYIFPVLWWLLEIILSLVFTIFGCVAMVNIEYADSEVVDEAFHLLSLNVRSVIGLKFLEEIIFGWLTRYILARIFGHLFASFVQSFMEVYFLMVWTTYYFCVKSLYAHRNGEPFGINVFRTLILN